MQPFLRWIAVWLVNAGLLQALAEPPKPTPDSDRLKALEQTLDSHRQDLDRRLTDLAWFQRLSDIAVVDKVRFTGPPPRVVQSSAPGASNELIITAWTFQPKKSLSEPKLPLLLYVHEGIHDRLDPDQDAHTIRELLGQGYAIVAPDYRGSSGYGRDFWEKIDYGGHEVDDVLAARTWALENWAVTETNRIGILGWSHGGMITLLCVLREPHAFAAAYAGVPVSDLIARLGYKGVGYRELFSAPYHLGKPPEEALDELRRRSPVTHADKLQTPLLVHANTSDEDVNIVEIENLIARLRAANRPFEHTIYTNAPGGHYFNRLNTRLARDSREEIYRFLARHLNPPGASRP